MRGLHSLIRRFGSDERGAFLALFGVMAIVLIATSGAAVDFTSVEQARTRAQVALDAAALALQDNIYTDTSEEIRTAAEDLLVERFGQTRITSEVETVEVNTDSGSLYLQARLTVPMAFVNLVGVSEMSVSVVSQVTRKTLNLEVVMVLDNSGSMDWYSRMDYLKEAATCATNILLAGDCDAGGSAATTDKVKVGIVPFTQYVNVGSSNSGAAWIDADGYSVAAEDNFDDDEDESTTFAGPLDRLALYDSITNDSWRGCVEARPHIANADGSAHYDTDDTTPISSIPETLFVPLFAPDAPDSWSASYNDYTADDPASCEVTTTSTATCTWTQTKADCDSSGGSCKGTVTNTYSPSKCSCGGKSVITDSSTWGWNSERGGNWTQTRVRTCETTETTTEVPTGLSDRELQERLCKYEGATLNYTTNQRGPNSDCPYEPILALTEDRVSVLGTIEDMDADGGTNIHEGTAWGLRVLSPTEPFTEGDAYDEGTAKVMIIMTDGENTAYYSSNMNGAPYFSAYGFPYNSTSNSRRGAYGWTEAQMETEMDSRLEETCTQAKAVGITIYSIGLSSPDDRKDTLMACASGEDYYFFPDDPSELEDIFSSIARELGDLRIAQ